MLKKYQFSVLLSALTHTKIFKLNILLFLALDTDEDDQSFMETEAVEEDDDEDSDEEEDDDEIADEILDLNEEQQVRNLIFLYKNIIIFYTIVPFRVAKFFLFN